MVVVSSRSKFSIFGKFIVFGMKHFMQIRPFCFVCFNDCLFSLMGPPLPYCEVLYNFNCHTTSYRICGFFLSCKLLDSNAHVLLHCSALFDFAKCSEMHLHLDLNSKWGSCHFFFFSFWGWVLVFNMYQVQSTPRPKKKKNVEWRGELGESKRGWYYYITHNP